MIFRGKPIDPFKLWSSYCDIKEDKGPFLPLCFCPNPNHLNSRSPAFQINIEKPLVHCFSNCGVSGSYEHAICLIEGLYDKYKVEPFFNEKKSTTEKIFEQRRQKRKAYQEARKIIYLRAGSSYQFEYDGKRRNRVGRGASQSKLLGEAKELNEVEDLSAYSYLPKEALDYLKIRKINQGSRARWQIGYDEKLKRITIPAFDHRDRLRFVIKRGIYRWQEPPYLYPAAVHKSSLLLGHCYLDPVLIASMGLIVVEGVLDCIRLHQHGYRNTVAIFGSSLSQKQRKLIAQIRPHRIYLFFDQDVAGVRALETSVSLLTQYQVKVPLYPRGSQNADPASLSKKEVERAFNAAVPVFRMMKKIRQARERV